MSDKARVPSWHANSSTTPMRLLLLSATPFKMYTLPDEPEGDDHYARLPTPSGSWPARGARRQGEKATLAWPARRASNADDLERARYRA